MDFSGVTFCKKAVDRRKVDIGELLPIGDTDDDVKLQKFYRERGYLFIRNAIPRQLVLNARKEILQKYAIIGEVDDRQDVTLGIQLNNSYREQVNVRALRQSIVSGYYYQSVSRFSAIQNIVSRTLSHESKMLDYLWPRLASSGSGTALHQDAPFITGAKVGASVSVWTPLGDISPQEGSLVILNGSHKSEALRNEYGNKDVDKENKFGWYGTSLYESQQKIGGEWLTAEFKAGDIIIFDLMTLHGAFDNNSKCRVRLSSDSRYQSTEHAIHPRWQGESAVGRSKARVFLPQATRIDTLINSNLNTEFHDIDKFGKIKKSEENV